MPPEALQGKIEKESDIYSFGIIIYEILTRKTPFNDVLHNLELAKKISSGLKPRLTCDENNILCSLYEKCTKINITDRPSAKDIYNSLNEIIQN